MTIYMNKHSDQNASGSTNVYIAERIPSEDNPHNTTPSFFIDNMELVFYIKD